jgi:hypothetical protein
LGLFVSYAFFSMRRGCPYGLYDVVKKI